MKLYRWGATIPDRPYWVPYTRIHQWMIRAPIPIDQAQWIQHEFLTHYCDGWTVAEASSALRGVFPDETKLAQVGATIPADGYAFADLENWAPKPGLSIGGKSPEQVASLLRDAWVFCVSRLKQQSPQCNLGVYSTPESEGWQGITRSRLAGDVAAHVLETRYRRWRDIFDGLASEGFFGHVDCFCPSLYVRYENPRMWRASAEDMLRECERLYAHNARPVIPFVSCRFKGLTPVLDRSYWSMVLRWLADNVAGAVCYEPPDVVTDSWYYDAVQLALSAGEA